MTTRLVRPRLAIALIAALTLLIAGCCSQVFFVAIPAEDYRSAKDPFPLPLSEVSTTQLMGFLRSGADQSKVPDIVDLKAGMYDSLLVLLKDTVYLKVEFLEGKTRFRKWFSDEPVYGVIDARDEMMGLLDRPISYLTDGKYWWVFYREGSALTHVLVVKNMMREPKKGE